MTGGGAHGQGHDPASDGTRVTRAGIAAIAVALALIALKGWAFAATGSVAMLGSLIDSSLDFLASAINLFAIRQALVPPDHEHRYGHGKAEALAGLMQAAFIGGSAVFLALESAQRLLRPEPVAQGWIGIAVMVISIGLTGALVWYQRRVAHQTGSLAVSADSLHYAGDLAMNAAVILALAITATTGAMWADPLFGLAVAALIGWGAVEILRAAGNQLMDREVSDEVREAIRKIACAHPEVRGVHDLRTRASGTRMFAQLHLELDPGMPLMRAHEISDTVEAALVKAYPALEVIIHQDPEGMADRHHHLHRT